MPLCTWLVKLSIVGSLCDREAACSASNRQGSNFESCVWRAVSSHHPQEVLLAQLRLHLHKRGLKPDSFHFLKPAKGWMSWIKSWWKHTWQNGKFSSEVDKSDYKFTMVRILTFCLLITTKSFLLCFIRWSNNSYWEWNWRANIKICKCLSSN